MSSKLETDFLGWEGLGGHASELSGCTRFLSAQLETLTPWDDLAAD